MSLELIWNVKISADSTFSFWAIESNRKRGMGGISRKGHLRRKESDQSYFFWKEVEVDVKVFNFKILAKIRCLIQEPCKLSCCGRKNILVVTILNLLKSVKCRIFKFDKNLWKWLTILTFPRILRFRSGLYGQDENAESTEFLGKLPLWR